MSQIRIDLDNLPDDSNGQYVINVESGIYHKSGCSHILHHDKGSWKGTSLSEDQLKKMALRPCSHLQ